MPGLLGKDRQNYLPAAHAPSRNAWAWNIFLHAVFLFAYNLKTWGFRGFLFTFCYPSNKLYSSSVGLTMRTWSRLTTAGCHGSPAPIIVNNKIIKRSKEKKNTRQTKLNIDLLHTQTRTGYSWRTTQPHKLRPSNKHPQRLYTIEWIERAGDRTQRLDRDVYSNRWTERKPGYFGQLIFLDLLELKLSLEWFQESGSVHMSIILFLKGNSYSTILYRLQ